MALAASRLFMSAGYAGLGPGSQRPLRSAKHRFDLIPQRSELGFPLPETRGDLRLLREFTVKAGLVEVTDIKYSSK